MLGSSVLAGSSAPTALVCGEVADALPTLPVAVTMTSIASPTSSGRAV